MIPTAPAHRRCLPPSCRHQQQPPFQGCWVRQTSDCPAGAQHARQKRHAARPCIRVLIANPETARVRQQVRYQNPCLPSSRQVIWPPAARPAHASSCRQGRGHPQQQPVLRRVPASRAQPDAPAPLSDQPRTPHLLHHRQWHPPVRHPAPWRLTGCVLTGSSTEPSPYRRGAATAACRLTPAPRQG